MTSGPMPSPGRIFGPEAQFVRVAQSVAILRSVEDRRGRVAREDVERPDRCLDLHVPRAHRVERHIGQNLGRRHLLRRCAGQRDPWHRGEIPHCADRVPRQERHAPVAGEEAEAHRVARAPAAPVAVEVDTGRPSAVGRQGEPVRVGMALGGNLLCQRVERGVSGVEIHIQQNEDIRIGGGDDLGRRLHLRVVSCDDVGQQQAGA
jgi:hypothetical protein